MSLILRSIAIFLLLLSFSHADINSTEEDQSSYIDTAHKNFSETIIQWSKNIDTMLHNWLEENDTNASIVSPDSTLEDRVKSTDSFFQSDKYLNETDNTYIRVRAENYFQSKGSSDFGLELRAQVPFTKTRKNLKIFLDNMTLDNAKDILKDEDEAPDIGIRYFKLEKMIQSRYSIGFRGIDPFVSARYNMPIQTDKWFIDVVQSFKYSLDDKFEEETNIYFDKEVGKESLLRVQLYRRTQEEIAGMDYALFLQYYRSLSRHTGYGISQAFIGNTKYEYTVDNGIEPAQIKHYGGINNYITSFSWRTNVWRKWFFVEVRPSVSFDKQFDYEPNYRVRLFFDIYLGRFN